MFPMQDLKEKVVRVRPCCALMANVVREDGDYEECLGHVADRPMADAVLASFRAKHNWAPGVEDTEVSEDAEVFTDVDMAVDTAYGEYVRFRGYGD